MTRRKPGESIKTESDVEIRMFKEGEGISVRVYMSDDITEEEGYKMVARWAVYLIGADEAFARAVAEHANATLDEPVAIH